MFAIALVSFFLGAALGWNFRVLTVLPAIGFSATCTIIMGLVQGGDVSSIALAVVLSAMGLELGYLAAAIMGQSRPTLTAKNGHVAE
jgi:hypothetical protein